MSDLLPILNTILLGLLGGGGFWLWRADRRLRHAQASKEEASAGLTEVDAAEKIKELSLGLLKPLEDKICSLEKEVKELRAKLDKYVKREGQLERIINDKNDRIAALEAELDGAHRDREQLHQEVEHLKDRLHNAGINGE